jgi:hypothetical protein
MPTDSEKKPGRNAAIALACLLVLFIGRVAVQLWQYFWPTDALPPFSAWQSGALPYPALVASQIAIIAVSLWTIARIADRKLGRRRRIGLALLALGILYFGFMAFRLVAGLTFLQDSPFFGVILPAIFHLVLASMLIIVGLHLRRSVAQPA